jgi:hypothetical protein
VKILSALWLLISLVPSLSGQVVQNGVPLLSNNQVPGTLAAVNSIRKYCGDVDDFSKSHQARLFAQTQPDMNKVPTWLEFSSKAEWKYAGRPTPIALAWYRDGGLIRGVIAFDKGDDDGSSYADYCYQQNGKLAQLATQATQTACDDANFWCHITFGIDWVYLPDGRKVPVMNRTDTRLLKSERTYFTSSKEDPPEYFNVNELPFAHFLTPFPHFLK